MPPKRCIRWILSVALVSSVARGFSPSNWTQLIFKKFGGSDELLDVGEVESVVSIITNEKSPEVLARCDDADCSAECITLRRVYSTESWPFSLKLSQSNFEHICPSLLFMLTQDCAHSSVNATLPPTQAEVWGFSVLFSVLISISTLAGALVVLPCHGTRAYGLSLAFLISLATGCLVSNSVFVLLPEAFDVHDNQYMWKACTVIGGLYLFYVMERLLHLGLSWGCCRERVSPHEQRIDGMEADHSHHRGRSHHHHHSHDVPHNLVSLEPLLPKESALSLALEGKVTTSSSAGEKSISEKSKVVEKMPTKVASVAYVILIGHGFHNLLQGMSIGAAFTSNTILGISVSLAIICEELPHGLGDFAILLSSGINKRKAVLLNFLSGCPCFIGLIIGIKLAEVTSAASWILGAAGGIFLYIGLADMLPEMNAAAEDLEASPFVIFVIQNVGLLAGIVGMGLLAVFSKDLGAH